MCTNLRTNVMWLRTLLHSLSDSYVVHAVKIFCCIYPSVHICKYTYVYVYSYVHIYVFIEMYAICYVCMCVSVEKLIVKCPRS